MTHLVATSPDLITLTDLATGRYVMVNDAFVRVRGWTPRRGDRPAPRSNSASGPTPRRGRASFAT